MTWIAITRKDGGVSLMPFITAEYGPEGAATRTRAVTPEHVQQEIALWMSSLGDDLDRWTPILGWRTLPERHPLQDDREFRMALVDHPTEGLTHDVERAKTVALTRVRELRGIAFGDFDSAWLTALRQGDTTQAAQVDAQRQILRDQPNLLTKALDAVTSVAEIRAAVANSHAQTQIALAAGARAQPG